MAVNIGPKIGIDGEAQFRKEINNLIQQQKTLSAEMKAVTSAFDKNTSAEEKSTATSKVLTQQIEVQKNRLQQLNDMLDKSTQKFGENDTRTLKWKEAVNSATAELNKMERQLQDTGEEVDDTGEKFSGFGDLLKANLAAEAIVSGIKGIASAIGDVVDQTQEYRKIMGTLEASSQAAGYTAEQTSEAYYQLYWALGDEQATATTTANLQALQLEQGQLNDLINMTVGAWATYGDSIPIDGLAESINETIRSGQVTGTFADVLNWGSKEGETFGVMLKENTEANKEWNDAVASAQTAEDYFNLALQDAGTQAEKTNLVMQAMASQGLADTADAWYQNNSDIVDANNAQLDFMNITSQFAERVAPAVNAVRDGFNDVLKALLDMTTGVDFAAVEQGIQSAFDYLVTKVIPAVKDAVNFVIANKDVILATIAAIAAGFAAWTMATTITTVVAALKNFQTALVAGKTAMQALSLAMNASPFGIIVTAIAALVAALVTLWVTNEDFRNAVISIWEKLKSAVGTVVDALVGFFTQTLPEAFESLQTKASDVVDKIKTFFSNLWKSIKETVGGIAKSVKDGIQDAIDFITDLPGKAIQWGKDFIGGLIDGIKDKIGAVKDAVSGIADTIASWLHFSRPDIGPLREYESWMPDMIEGMAAGIYANAGKLSTAVGSMAGGMAAAAAGTVNATYNMTINGAAGQDINALSNIVMRKIQSATDRKGAVWA